MRRSPAAPVFLTIACLLWWAPAAAQIAEVTINIDGMTWALWAVQAEKALRRLEGVATVRVTLREKTARVTLKTDAVFEPEKFRAAIESASQWVRAFELRLLAAVEQRGGRYYLRPSGVRQLFLVQDGALTAKLKGFAGKQVRATGRLVSSSSPLELQLTEIAPPWGAVFQSRRLEELISA